MRLNPRVVRYGRILPLLLVVLYGALLRLDAIAAKFEPVHAPRWVRQLEIARTGPSALRPAGMHWDFYPRVAHKDGPPSQYKSDPYTYLQYAREMHAFYAAHRREPLFPFATKVWLWLLHDDDSAGRFAAGAFSVLAIVLTFALGREAFSSPVGLVAAALWAIEFDVISSGTEGWRDDAFTCAVLLTAWCLLRFARQPDGLRAMLLGLAGGVACLVRITSISFVLPAIATALFETSASTQQRLRFAAVAAFSTFALVAPFLMNSWRVYGDPLYAINVHANVYQATEGQAPRQDLSAREYITTHLRGR